MEKLRWLIFSNSSNKFPYKPYVEKYPSYFLCLDVQERRPVPNKQIYCLRKGHFDEKQLPVSEPIESCFIKSKKQYGKKLEIILDRKIKKRCWFLFLKKEYKKRPGKFYEQIFWITQSSAKIRRKGTYIPKGGKEMTFEVIQDIRERYPHKFEKAIVKKGNLPCGDYGLLKNGEVIAVVSFPDIQFVFCENRKFTNEWI
ncbi:MAG: hypothetical protein ACK4F0_06125 [Candidatus Ratteibacteria bacterium]